MMSVLITVFIPQTVQNIVFCGITSKQDKKTRMQLAMKNNLKPLTA